LQVLLQDVRKVEEYPLLDDGQVGALKNWSCAPFLRREAIHVAGGACQSAQPTNAPSCATPRIHANCGTPLNIGHRTGRGIVLFFMDIVRH